MKIQRLTLKEIEVREVNGEFEQVSVNERSYPIFLTNYALKKGKEKGLIETSLFADLLKLQALEGLQNGVDNIDPEALESLDEEKMQRIVYLAFCGANKNDELSFDEFLQKYHYNFTETITMYMQLITGLLTSDSNAFAKGLKASTSKSNKNEKK